MKPAVSRPMTDEVVVEGDGTGDEMEARLITELKRRNWLTQEAIERMEIEEEPPADTTGSYRIRLRSLSP